MDRQHILAGHQERRHTVAARPPPRDKAATREPFDRAALLETEERGDRTERSAGERPAEQLEKSDYDLLSHERRDLFSKISDEFSEGAGGAHHLPVHDLPDLR